MNTLKRTIHKSIIAGLTLSTMLGLSDISLVHAAIQPTGLTYYTTDTNGTITDNTMDETSKDIIQLDIENTTPDQFAHAVKADNKTIKVHLATDAVINVSSDLGSASRDSDNNAKAVGVEARNGGAVDLYGSGTINISSIPGAGAGTGDKLVALAYGFWNSEGDGNTIKAHGDNLVINAQIKADYKEGAGFKELSILKNTATNSSITIGNGYQVTGTALDGKDEKGLNMFFANNDYQSGGTATNAGGSSITIGNGTAIDFQSSGNSQSARVSIAENGTENKTLHGNSKIVFGNDSKININIDGHAPTSILAMNNLTQAGATASIEFGNNTSVTIENTVHTGAATIYGASNYFATGASKIAFGDNTTLQLSSKRKEGGTVETNYIYGAHDYGSTNGQISFGNNTTFDFDLKDKEGGVFAVYKQASQGSLTKFGNGTTINIAAEGIAKGLSINAIGVWQQQDANSKVEFGNNTTINTQVNGGINQIQTNAVGAYLLASTGSELKFGTNTTINSRAVGTSGMASGIYLSRTKNTNVEFGTNTTINSRAVSNSGMASGIYLSGTSNTNVEFGSGTRIFAHGTGTAGEAVTASGIYLTGGAKNATVSLNGDTFMSIVTDKVAGKASSAYAIYDNGDATNKTYVNVDYTDPANTTLGAGKVQITGDVFAYKGTIYLGLNGAESYLNGRIYQRNDGQYSGKVVLYMDNGAKWNLTANSFNAAGAPTTLATNIAFDTLNIGSNCQIDLTADNAARQFESDNNHNYRTLRSTNGNFKITGTDNTFILNSDVANNISDTIVIDSTVTGENYIKINYDPSLAAGKELSDLGSTKVVEQAGNGNFEGTFKVKASVGGLNKYLPIIYKEGDDNWYITGFTQAGTSDTVQLVGKALENNMALAMQTMLNSDLSRRMGEIRDNPDNAGAWVKISAGEKDIGNGSGQEYSTIQGGIDKQIKAKRGSHFVGLAFEHTTANNTYDIESAGGRGNTNMFTLYNTWSGNDGHYYDIVAKTGKLNGRANLIDENFKSANLEYANWMTGVSFEYGVRKQLTGDVYWQPEVQLAYSRINGTNYSSTNDVSVSQDAANSLIGRLGITLGKKTDKNSSIYITASVLKEFLGKTTTHLAGGADRLAVDTDMSSIWGEIVIGANTKLNSKTDMYVQAATNIGGKVRTKWQTQAGFRWNW